MSEQGRRAAGPLPLLLFPNNDAVSPYDPANDREVRRPSLQQGLPIFNEECPPPCSPKYRVVYRPKRYRRRRG